MFKATFSLGETTDRKTGKSEIKYTVVEKETAELFLKHLRSLHHSWLIPVTIKSASKCSIDGIAVKPGYFHSVLQEEENKIDGRRFKEIDPFHHFGLTSVDIEAYGLKRVGKEIFVRRPPNEDDFFKILENTQEGKLLTLYHGTNSKNISSILMSGLKASKTGAFGRGLYVGPFEKAKGYNGRDGLRKTSVWHGDGKANHFATIFELDVILGKSLNANALDKNKWQKEYDSVYYTGFRNVEYCLRDARQVMIKKIILL